MTKLVFKIIIPKDPSIFPKPAGVSDLNYPRYIRFNSTKYLQ